MGETSASKRTRAITYCLVPRDLADRLHEPLREHFRSVDVEVVVERRADDRRTGSEGRRAPGAEPRDAARERRAVRSSRGRRVAERRALTVAATAVPELPRKARRYAKRLVFVERLEPSEQHVRDADSKRLVTRFQAGDQAAFGELYLRYFNPVYTYAKVALADHHEAEDVTQQVFVRVLGALDRYELRPGVPFRGWLFSIARNVMLNAVKHRHGLVLEPPDQVDLLRERGHGRDLPEANLTDSLGWLSDREIAMFVERLPAAQRQVLVLRFMLDLSGEEIAQVLGRSHLAVRQLQTRALAQLQQRLTAIGRAAPRRDRTRMRMRLRPMPVTVRRRFALGIKPPGAAR
jgi:RNA polymerase sigma-70 factor (ECF subfamily)